MDAINSENSDHQTAQTFMRGFMRGILGLDYDQFRVGFPGGPDAYDRRVRGTQTEADLAAWRASVAEETQRVAETRAIRKAQRQQRKTQR